MVVNRLQLVLCSSLTLHYSILSLALHYCSQARQAQFHPSTAIFFTELGKIIVSLSLIASTGELRESVKERRRIREVTRVREIEDEERKLLTLERERERERDRERDDRELADVWQNQEFTHGEATSLLKEETRTKIHQRKTSTTALSPSKHVGLSISVERAKSFNPTSTPSLAVIPPTPAPEPSPTTVPEISLLFPYRPSREPEERRTAMEDLKEKEWWKVVRASVFGRGSSSVAIVASLYALQNRAQYSAAANLSVPMFQLAYQLKIPATAMCSVILLNRSLSIYQWTALFTLTFGVGVVQLCSVLADSTPLEGVVDPDLLDVRPNQLWGLSAVVFACLSSGFASCLFERILKIPSTSSSSGASSPTTIISPTLPSSTQQPPLPDPSSIVPANPSLWVRNIQLSTFGLLGGLPFVLYDLRSSFSQSQSQQDIATYLGETPATRAFESFEILASGFFQGFSSPIVWFVIFLQVSGGLLSALVILHADNLLKCFATSLSILLSLVASVLLFDFTITPGIAVGASLVLAATLAYTSPSTFQSLLTSPLAILFRIYPR
ncbi:uncharacterized protein JCM6883_006270 [Sporobolomyces salmoneus]|uniref:uncharacterized protein n=1 Tax=Sporobolomyces salmoneus TaxID=183962 RepID=UPI00317BB6EF